MSGDDERTRISPSAAAGVPGRIGALVEQVAALPGAARREALESACGGDDVLREAVLAALAERDAGDATVEVGARPPPSGALPAPPGPADPAVVGPFRLLERIGVGGMGTVHLAERVGGDFEQRVALKLVRRGMDSESVLARFLQERRILARLDHPGIARLIDGGIAADGRPYFAMEHVDGGVPIHEAANRRGLSVARRVELFLDVCDAVEAAHRSLVVHCDLKPTNILLTPAGTVKLVDFGIARLLESEEDQAATRFGVRALTPAYAAPEQLKGQKPTTQSDVYSLGVVLFELLAGVLPHPGPFASSREHEDTVTGTDPPPASRAARRAVDDGRASRLRGDLDAILARALERDPGRRYGSVESLAADLRRHLSGHPVQARPPDRRYRIGKFVRRHRVGVLLGAVAALAVVAGTAGIAWQGRIAAAERDRATREAERAEATREFLSTLLQSVDPFRTGGAAWTAEQLLDEGVEQLAARTLDPVVEAEVLGILGGVGRSLGQHERAEALWRRSVELLRARPAGASEIALATALQGLGRTLYDQDRNEESRATFEEALAHARAAPPGPEAAAIEARVLQSLGTLRLELGELDRAREAYRTALGRLAEVGGDTRAETAAVLVDLASISRFEGDLETAERLGRRALALEREVHGSTHPTLATTMNVVAITLRQRGDFVAAEDLQREALEISLTAFGEKHPQVSTWRNNLALTLRHRGAYEEAAALLRRVLEVDLELLGEGHAWVAYSRNNLAAVLLELGESAEARELLVAGYEGLVASRGPRSPPLAGNRIQWATLQAEAGDLAGAASTLTEALAILAGSDASASAAVYWARTELARVLWALGAPEEAEAQVREGLGLLDREAPELAEKRVQLLGMLGRLLLARAESVEASRTLEEAWGIAATKLPAGNRIRSDAGVALVAAREAVGRSAEAAELAGLLREELAGGEGRFAEELRSELEAASARTP